MIITRVLFALFVVAALLGAACQETYSDGRGYRPNGTRNSNGGGNADSTLYRGWKERVVDDAQSNLGGPK